MFTNFPDTDSIKSEPENRIWAVAMMDAELILGYLTPRVFALAMLLDVISSVLLPIGNKGILKTLHVVTGNEKEQEEIKKAIYGIIWRYLPILLFLFVSILQLNLSLDLHATRVIHLFLTVWALVCSRNYLGFNIYNFGAVLNMLVCSLNKGMMPTIYPPLDDGRHILMTDATRFNFLCDWIVSGYSMISVGDVLIAIGALIFLTCQNYIFINILINRSAKPAEKK